MLRSAAGQQLCGHRHLAHDPGPRHWPRARSQASSRRRRVEVPGDACSLGIMRGRPAPAPTPCGAAALAASSAPARGALRPAVVSNPPRNPKPTASRDVTKCKPCKTLSCVRPPCRVRYLPHGTPPPQTPLPQGLNPTASERRGNNSKDSRTFM